ncbi:MULTISPECIES: zinc-binding alcohol dehydrogenase [unclassified Microbacterium]|uniref:zinc-binding alcohol dehydrogenase n=1 Tax=unclassified Microbacterium TaxID=2609290 RepID=UPI003744F7F4
MRSGSGPEWVVREDAGLPVLLALALRQAIGVRSPDDLPHLRGGAAETGPARGEEAQARLERQWREYWAMTVEPQAHPSPVPLELVDGFDTVIALPAEGMDDLRAAIEPHAGSALHFARGAHERYSRDASARPGVSYRAYASAIAEHERRVGRRAHSFELNVQVLPLTQRGVWWIGSLTIAVTDGLRGDVVAFDTAIHPIIAELA